jgi:hypothetical protein
MPAEPGPLQIQLHLVDGNLATYEQTDPIAVGSILREVQPAKVFSERQILIAGGFTVSGYSTASVVRVDFVGEDVPDYRLGPEMNRLEEISRDAFEAGRVAGDDESRKRKRAWTVGETFSGFAELELNNGAFVFLEFESTLRSKLDQRLVLQHFLAGSGLYCKRLGGGASFINTAAVVRWTLFPGPPEAPQNAWVAHYAGASKKLMGN